ncbi:MAG: FliM/FliN family flagellar motor switch protein [Deltaproteobacteria bacterium]|nr:FliM/FliN family flagellar motor switch protein [Deltaproteobacteria bacterium]
MAEKIDSSLDDELLKELGLEPKEAPAVSTRPVPPRPSQTAAPKAQVPSAPMPSAGKAVSPMPPRPRTSPPAPPPAHPAVSPAPVQSTEQFQKGAAHLSDEMPVQVVAVLGKRTMTLKDVVALKQGEILELKKLPQEAIDLVANGKLMARGELVLVDGKLGIQIKQLVG